MKYKVGDVLLFNSNLILIKSIEPRTGRQAVFHVKCFPRSWQLFYTDSHIYKTAVLYPEVTFLLELIA